MESVKTQTINSAKWNAIEKFSSMGIQFLVTLIMARILSPEDYGIIAMLTIFIAVSTAFIDSGLNTALVRNPESSETDFSTVFYFNFAVAIVVYALLFFLAPLVASFFEIEILCPILRVYSISLIINSLMAVQVSKLQIKLDFKSLAIKTIIAALLSGFIGIYMAYTGWGVWSLVYQSILASVFNLVIICFICRWIPKAFFSVERFKVLGSFGIKLLAAGILDTIYKNLTTLAIGKFYSPSDLGYYSRGSQYACLPNNCINGVLGTVTYPIFARIQNDDEHLISVYRKYIQISSLVIFIVSGLISALAKPIVLLTIGEQWVDAIVYLQLFAFAYMFNHITTINLNLLKVKGYSNLFLKLEIIKKSISFSMICCAIPFGVLAICLTGIIYSQIAIFINTYYSGKLFKYGYADQFKDILPYFFKTIIACLPAFALTWLDCSSFIVLVIGGSIALFIYWLLLRRDAIFNDLISIVIEKIKKNNNLDVE